MITIGGDSYDMVNKTFIIKLEEYDTWFKEFSTSNKDSIPRIFDTTYVAHLNSVLISTAVYQRKTDVKT